VLLGMGMKLGPSYYSKKEAVLENRTSKRRFRHG